MLKELKLKRGKVTLVMKNNNKETRFLLKRIGESLNKLGEFFDVSLPFLKIYFAYSREEFNRLAKRKTESWEVGHTNSPQKEVYLLSPSVFEKESIHKRKDFSRVLTHELAHLFTYRLYPFFEPCWLIEGLAYCLAGQGRKDSLKKIKISSEDFLSKIATQKGWRENLYNGAYQLSYLFVDFLMKKFTKEKLLKLLKSLDFPYEKTRFTQVFKQVYQQNLDFLENRFAQKYFS